MVAPTKILRNKDEQTLLYPLTFKHERCGYGITMSLDEKRKYIVNYYNNEMKFSFSFIKLYKKLDATNRTLCRTLFLPSAFFAWANETRDLDYFNFS